MNLPNLSHIPTSKAAILLAENGWLSLSMFAKLIAVSYPTAFRMHKTGKVITVTVGGIHRVYAEEIKRFLKQGNAEGGELNPLPSSSE